MAGPARGRLASGLAGQGRMIEVRRRSSATCGGCWAAAGDLAGRKVVVSAGGTREALDPVRFVTNRSSGKMGYAVAEAARDRGADTVVVAAPNDLPDPVGARVVSVVSAGEMLDALREECAGADALVMAAAVSDWRPAEAAEAKIKKGDAESMTLDLVRTPDVIASLRGNGLVKVGFAAETDDVLVNARAKLVPKGLDLIAANDVTGRGQRLRDRHERGGAHRPRWPHGRAGPHVEVRRGQPHPRPRRRSTGLEGRPRRWYQNRYESSVM